MDPLIYGNASAVMPISLEGDISIDHCIFQNNSGASAVANITTYGLFTISNSQFINNNLATAQNAINIGSTNQFTIENTLIANNSGGGIRMDFGAQVLISHSTIINNGDLGITLFSCNNCAIRNSTIANNANGGIYFYILEMNPSPAFDFTISNSTIVDNGSNYGNLSMNFYNSSNKLNFDNSIAAMTNPADLNCKPVRPNHQVVAINSIFNENSCAATGSGIIIGLPMLGPVSNNGGSTPTMLPLPGSPAIDGGDNATCEVDDERALPRPAGAACDIGAVEVQ